MQALIIRRLELLISLRARIFSVMSEIEDFELLGVEGFSSQQIDENGEKAGLVGEFSGYMIVRLQILEMVAILYDMRDRSKTGWMVWNC